MHIYITYDMEDGKEEECQEYLANKLAPGLAKMGFQFSNVWFKMWGDSPQILAGGEVDNVEQARKIFRSSEWKKLAAGMEPLARDLKVKLVKPRLDTSD